MSSKATLDNLDKRIAAGLRTVGMVDSATILGVKIDGYFIEDSVEQGAGNDIVSGLLRTFDCSADDLATLPRELDPQDRIAIEGYGEYRYIGTEDHGNNRKFLILGTLL